MKKQFLCRTLIMVLAVSIAGCDRDHSNDDDITVIKASGDITSSLNQFRQVLGSTLNTQPGAVGGRREINWDGVPDSLLGKELPPRFFNPIGDDPALAPLQRGLVYAPQQGVFMVSNTQFGEVNGEASAEFAAFSGDKTFANVSSVLWEIDPEVPGKGGRATVQGFGIVFSDVDKDSSTFIEFFSDSRSLGRFFVPKHDSSSSFSFLGVHFKNEKVSAIKVGHEGFLSANQQDISQGGANDLVILDDFLYDEPVKK